MTSRLPIALTLIVLVTGPSSAQGLLAAAVQRDIQRFPDDVVPNRLDGAAIGWSVGASARVPRHLALAVEWTDAGAIADTRTVTLEVNGRTVAIMSTFRHRTRVLAALAGYHRTVASRVGVAFLIGVAFSHVRREFTSTAAGSVLVPPSTLATPDTSLVDRFRAVTGGVDAHVRVAGRVHVVTGVRAQRLALQPDLNGWGARTFVGAGWAF